MKPENIRCFNDLAEYIDVPLTHLAYVLVVKKDQLAVPVETNGTAAWYSKAPLETIQRRLKSELRKLCPGETQALRFGLEAQDLTYEEVLYTFRGYGFSEQGARLAASLCTVPIRGDRVLQRCSCVGHIIVALHESLSPSWRTDEALDCLWEMYSLGAAKQVYPA